MNNEIEDKACIAELRIAVEHRCRPDIDDIDAANILHVIDTLRRKLQAAEVCYKDALDRLHGARNAALEEAAKVCAEQWMIDGTETASEFASVIRELKDQPCTDHQ